MKFFAFIGLLCAVALTAMDFWTSYYGISGIVGEQKTPLLQITPIILATLAIVMNGLSGHLFSHIKNMDFEAKGQTFFMLIWMVFVLYDWISSIIGLVFEFKGEVLGLTEILPAFLSLSIGQIIVAITIGVLAASGPFLTTVFASLTFGNK